MDSQLNFLWSCRPLQMYAFAHHVSMSLRIDANACFYMQIQSFLHQWTMKAVPLHTKTSTERKALLHKQGEICVHCGGIEVLFKQKMTLSFHKIDLNRTFCHPLHAHTQAQWFTWSLRLSHSHLQFALHLILRCLHKIDMLEAARTSMHAHGTWVPSLKEHRMSSESSKTLNSSCLLKRWLIWKFC